jgi:hypothetical protein
LVGILAQGHVGDVQEPAGGQVVRPSGENVRQRRNGRPRLRYLQIDEVRIPFLAPEDLIWLKQDSWREKDRLDVLALKEIIAREQRRG